MSILLQLLVVLFEQYWQ